MPLAEKLSYRSSGRASLMILQICQYKGSKYCGAMGSRLYNMIKINDYELLVVDFASSLPSSSSGFPAYSHVGATQNGRSFKNLKYHVD